MTLADEDQPDVPASFDAKREPDRDYLLFRLQNENRRQQFRSRSPARSHSNQTLFSTTSNKGRGKGKRICYDFCNGNCNRGDKCGYKHNLTYL